jgi:uncharacterized protein (TIGR03435 family)
MARLFLECTIRAALIVLGTALVLYALRVKVPAVRHRVWAGVLLLMLALPLWTAWGPKAQFRLLPASVERVVTETAPSTPAISTNNAQAVLPANENRSAARPVFSKFDEALLGLYLFGALVLLVRLAIGTAKANILVRESVESDGLRTNARCAAPVTVGCLGAVLAHEREHVRRRDPLVQWLALLNRSIFWFHPAAWWLERELSALAEESCDAAVIAQGHDPRDYAEALMNMARAVMKSGSRVNLVSVAMPGPRLPERIRKIVDAAPASRISRARAACIVLACAAICVTFLAGALTRAQSSTTEDWEEAAGGKMSFEVASIKRSSGPGAPMFSNFALGNDDRKPPNGVLNATNLPLMSYIAFAYKVDISQERSLGARLPQWTHHIFFTVEARPQGSNLRRDQVRLMMQSLLADRFKLKAHFETKDGPAYALVLARAGKVGSQMRAYPDGFPCSEAVPAGIGGRGGPAPTMATVDDGRLPASCGHIQRMPRIEPGIMRQAGRNLTMDALLVWISMFGNLDRPLADRTGLSGTFDVSVESSLPVPPGADAASPGTTFLQAVNDQLGLKLQSITAPVNTLIIDHVEEPSPN